MNATLKEREKPEGQIILSSSAPDPLLLYGCIIVSPARRYLGKQSINVIEVVHHLREKDLTLMLWLATSEISAAVIWIV